MVKKTVEDVESIFSLNDLISAGEPLSIVRTEKYQNYTRKTLKENGFSSSQVFDFINKFEEASKQSQNLDDLKSNFNAELSRLYKKPTNFLWFSVPDNPKLLNEPQNR